MILTIPSSLIIPSIPSSISQKEAKGRDLYYVDEKKTIISCSSVVSICPDLEIFMTKKNKKEITMHVVCEEIHVDLCQLILPEC